MKVTVTFSLSCCTELASTTTHFSPTLWITVTALVVPALNVALTGFDAEATFPSGRENSNNALTTNTEEL